VPSKYGAPPAGVDAAGPRADLRGYRLGVTALVSRPMELLRARRFHGLIGGFVSGLVLGSALLATGAPDWLALALAAIANVAIALTLPTMLLSRTDRRLLGIVWRLSSEAARAWRRAYGTAPIPRTEEQQLLWIAAQPTTTTDPEALSIEASTFLILGRYADARERVERLPDDAPLWRFDRAIAMAAIEFDSGTGPGDLKAARAAAQAIHGGRRAAALAELALEEAALAMIRGDDWDPPIARAAGAAGSPVVGGVVTALAGWRGLLPWLLISQLALGAVLYVVTSGLRS
jgi:hypothetical protein